MSRIVLNGSLSPVAPPPVSNARLAIILFIVAEVMLFGTLVGGYVILRMGSNNFAGMGSLPIGLTGISTATIILSSVFLIISQRSLLNPVRLKYSMLATLVSGSTFLVLQLFEWNSLLNLGLTPKVSINDGLFYLLSGLHGLHVAGGLGLLLFAVIKAFRSGISVTKRSVMDVTSVYWHFVTIVWVALFLMLFIL